MIHFDIDLSQLLAAANEVGASEKEFRASFGRACARTAATLRKLSGKGLRDELQLRTLGNMRRRLKSIRLRGTKDGVAIWYGLNDMPVSYFKGRPRQTAEGATKNGVSFAGGFVRKNKRGQATIMKRKGKARLPIEEQLMPIKDKADVYVEDEIFPQLEGIFWHHFEKDIRARVKFLSTSERWK